jgi:hypothetical protein
VFRCLYTQMCNCAISISAFMFLEVDGQNGKTSWVFSGQSQLKRPWAIACQAIDLNRQSLVRPTRQRAGRAKTKDPTARWHHASRDVAVEVNATASDIGAKKRRFNLDLTHCPHCGGQLRIVAVILQRQAIEKILNHLRVDPQPPPRARARGQMAF